MTYRLIIIIICDYHRERNIARRELPFELSKGIEGMNSADNFLNLIEDVLQIELEIPSTKLIVKR